MKIFRITFIGIIISLILFSYINILRDQYVIYTTNGLMKNGQVITENIGQEQSYEITRKYMGPFHGMMVQVDGEEFIQNEEFLYNYVKIIGLEPETKYDLTMQLSLKSDNDVYFTTTPSQPINSYSQNDDKTYVNLTSQLEKNPNQVWALISKDTDIHSLNITGETNSTGELFLILSTTGDENQEINFLVNNLKIELKKSEVIDGNINS